MKFLLGVAVGGFSVWYYLTKIAPSKTLASATLPDTTLKVSANGISETTKDLSKQIDAVHATVPVDLNAVTPNYGRPIEPIFARSNQKNFVDVINNDYFKPKMGSFRPIEGYSNPNIIGVPVYGVGMGMGLNLNV